MRIIPAGKQVNDWTFGIYLGRTYTPAGTPTDWYECMCVCGVVRRVNKNNILFGASTGCGCKNPGPVKHGGCTHGKRSPEMNALTHAIARCYNVKDKTYRWYGAKGVRVCSRWLNGTKHMHGVTYFLQDMGPKPSPKHSLDRINPFGNYTPKNCRWATSEVQAVNKRKNYIKS